MDIRDGHLSAKEWVGASSLPTNSLQQAIIGLTAFLTALCVLMFLLRIVSRFISKKMGIGKSMVHSCQEKANLFN